MKKTLLLVVCLALLDRQEARAQIEQWEIAPGFGLPIVTKTPEELAKQLESKDVKVRRDAVVALYFLKWHAQAAIPALTKALKDPDREVRGMAAGCFGFFGPPAGHPGAAVPILAEMLLKDSDLMVRQVCAVSLRHLTWVDKDLTREVAPALLQALEDKDQRIRIHVASALAIQGKGGQKPFGVLAECLDYEDEDRRWDAIRALGEIGLPALPTLRECLQHKSSRVRTAATHAFRKMVEEVRRKNQKFHPEVVAPLATALEDADKEVFTGAMWALQTIGPPAKETTPRLIKFLEHPDSDVRLSAVTALGEIGPAAKAAAPALERASSDSNSDVRRMAAQSLANIAGKAAIPTLEKMLSDDNGRVRTEVVKALGTIREDSASVVPALIRALAHEDSDVRLAAVKTLPSFGPDAAAAVPRITELLNDPNWLVRQYAATALGSFGPAAKKAVPGLIESLKDSDRLVRCYAADTLGIIRDDPRTVVPALIAALGDDGWAVRMWAARSLGCFGPEARAAVPRLTELLQDKNTNVRDAATEALKRIKGD